MLVSAHNQSSLVFEVVSMRFTLIFSIFLFITPALALAQHSSTCCDWGSDLSNPIMVCPDCIGMLCKARDASQKPDPGNILTDTCEVIEDVGSFVGNAAYGIGDTVVCQTVNTASSLFNFCHAGVYVFFWWSGVVPKPAGVQ